MQLGACTLRRGNKENRTLESRCCGVCKNLVPSVLLSLISHLSYTELTTAPDIIAHFSLVR